MRCVESTTFKQWLRVETARLLGNIDQAVEREMRNIKIEYFSPDEDHDDAS